MKKFFTAVPLQVAGSLGSYRYEAVGNSRLQMEGETSFPIITAMEGYLEPGETFSVVAVAADTETGRDNLESLRGEVDAVCRRKGALCRSLEVVWTGTDERVAQQTATFQKLIDHVEDDDELFSCMTFGTKPLSMAVMMAVRYAYRVKKNTSISCVVYGQVDRPDGDQASWVARVYDMTALVQLDEIVRVLAERGVTDPKKAIDGILSL